MARDIKVFTGSTGLNTKDDPVRLDFDPKTGVTDRAVAVNVEHDQTGRISRRKGFEATARTESAHSLFSYGDVCLYVSDSDFYMLTPGYGRKHLRVVTAGAKMRYVHVAGQIYYANGNETGRVDVNLKNSWTWVKGDYVGPETTRQLSDPPIGTILAHYNARIFVVQGKTVWYSEPFAHGAFDLAKNHFGFEENITMFRPVKDGIWVGTEKHIVFLVGGTPREFRRAWVAEYGVIEGTDDWVNMQKLPGEMIGLGAIWTSNEGICVGSPEGQFSNLTQDKIELWPTITARFGAGICMNDKYISLLEP